MSDEIRSPMEIFEEMERRRREVARETIRAAIPEIQAKLRAFVESRGYDPRFTPIVRVVEEADR